MSFPQDHQYDLRQRIAGKQGIVRGPMYRSPLDAYGGRVILMSDQELMNVLNNALVNNPNDIGARLDRAHRYADAGNLIEAVQDYQHVLQLDPQNAQANNAMRFLSQPLFSHTAAPRNIYQSRERNF